jgi:hypothetical protein
LWPLIVILILKRNALRACNQISIAFNWHFFKCKNKQSLIPTCDPTLVTLNKKVHIVQFLYTLSEGSGQTIHNYFMWGYVILAHSSNTRVPEQKLALCWDSLKIWDLFIKQFIWIYIYLFILKSSAYISEQIFTKYSKV